MSRNETENEHLGRMELSRLHELCFEVYGVFRIKRHCFFSLMACHINKLEYFGAINGSAENSLITLLRLVFYGDHSFR